MSQLKCVAKNIRTCFAVSAWVCLTALTPTNHVYANEVVFSNPSADPASTETTMTDQFIVTMRPEKDNMNQSQRNAKVNSLSVRGGHELAYKRSMSGKGHVLKLANKMSASDARALAKQLKNDPDVLSVEPDYIMHNLQQPNDTFYGFQWHYHSKISEPASANLPDAWDTTTGNSDVVIAVLDTGSLPHTDLAGQTVSGYDFISTTFVSNDGDGRDADPTDTGDATTAGYCFSGSSADSSSWHGTHVAGTIGAASNNGAGVAGVTWGSKIQHVRVLGRCGGYTSDIADGIRWAAGLTVSGVPNNATPAKVLNLSLGGQNVCTSGSVTQLAVNDAVANGAVVIVSAGNSNADAANFSPASCSGVITVAASNRAGGRANYSNFGSTVEITAPGGASPLNPDGVLSTLDSGSGAAVNDNSYYYYQGTSMSAPHVSGIAALLFSANHDLTNSYLTPAQINDKIASTARTFLTGTGSDCNTSICGAGHIDAADAVSAVSTAPTVSAGNDQSVDTNASVSLSGTATDDGTVSGVAWTQTAGTTVTLTNADALNASFTAPSSSDTLTFELEATDDVGIKTTDTINITVAPQVNVAPVAQALSESTAHNTAVTSAVTATDANGDALTYSVVANVTKGSLSFNTSTGNFTYTPNSGVSGTDTFTFKANDGEADSNTATITINIAAEPVANVAPVAQAMSFSTPNNTPVATNLIATDANGDALIYSLVTAPTKGSASLNANTGAITYTPDNSSTGTDEFFFKVNDGEALSNTAAVTVTLTPGANVAPVAQTLNLSTAHNTAVSSSVSATDGNGDTLTYSVVANASNGTVSLNASNGAFTYTPDNGTSGTDTFTFRANDGQLNSNTATVSITVAAAPVANTAPVAQALSISVDHNTTFSASVSATDVDGDALTYAQVANATKGTVSFNANGSFTYTPDNGSSGADSFTFTANDGELTSSAATVSITTATAPVANVAPVAQAMSFTTPNNTPVATNLLATDANGDALIYSLVTAPTKGSASLNANTGAITYIPDNSSTGTDEFLFKVNDGEALSNTASVTVTLTPSANVAPVAQTLNLSTAHNTAVSSSASATDGNGDTLTYSVVANASNGTVSLNASNGAFTYTPDNGTSGTDTFTFRANDGQVNSNNATVSITVAAAPAANSAPVAQAASHSADHNTAFSASVSATDVDGDALTYALVANVTKGTLSFNANGSFTYTPNNGVSGTDTFTFNADDTELTSNTATITITIAAAPVANVAPVTQAMSFTTPNNTPVATNLLATDANGDALIYSLVTAPTKGSASLNANTGAITYTPDNTSTGTDVFYFKVNDGEALSNTSTVTVTLTPGANIAAVAQALSLSTAHNTAVSSNVSATDGNGDTLTYSVVTNAANGTVSLNASNGAFTYTPDNDTSGTDSFTFRANDGQVNSNIATVSITVAAAPAANSAPVAQAQSVNVDHNTALSSSVSATDVDGDALTYAQVANATKGTVSFNANGNFTYTPNNGVSGADSFTFTANDGELTSSAATVSLTIADAPVVNVAPIAQSLSLSTAHNTPISNTLGATDANGDTLIYSLVTAPTKGNINFNSSTGAFLYTPITGASGVEIFYFKVNDGQALSNTATVSITIAAAPEVNVAPVAQSTSYSTAHNTSLIASAVASDSNGDALTYSLVANATKGGVVLNASTGVFTYTPNNGTTGIDTFSFRVDDGEELSNTATVTITIADAPDENNAPVAQASSHSTDFETQLTSSVSASDADGDSMTYSLVSSPSKGSINFDTNSGSFTYTPNSAESGVDTFSFSANDGEDVSNTATVSITVGADPDANVAPVASALSITTNIDTAVSDTLIASDDDGDELIYSLVTTPIQGTVNLDATTGDFTYTPDSGASGSDDFIFKVNDGIDISNKETVSITIE